MTNFVTPQFNLVIPAAVGIITVRRPALACFCCIVAVAFNLYSTGFTSLFKATYFWEAPPARSAQNYSFFVFSLVQWVASIIFSSFVVKTILKLTNLVITSFWVCIVIALLLLTAVYRGWKEYSSFQLLTSDGGIYYYLMFDQAMLLVREIIQGIIHALMHN